MKRILGKHRPPPRHWVGDGFPVYAHFNYGNHGRLLSPFLMLDYAAPHDFAPATTPRGVGIHPHRGFETVTIAYQGEIAHRDSTGQGGIIGPGDVQWMTAAAGILHEEFHSPAFTASGGTLEMVQLWVNLPAKDKLRPPGYQAISATRIPEATLPDAAGIARLIAGELAGMHGPARTHSPMQVWDLRLKAGSRCTLPAQEGWSVGLLVLRGAVSVHGCSAAANELVILDQQGDQVSLEAADDSTLLWLSGAALQEPVAGYGPFVMNTRAEIEQAIDDFNSGRFGTLPASS
ncbi:pirin family protein [Chitinilyticum piscinae]|uniref:Pirin family protein n=1 Tax=Chitinilyticum piscinae TaxID=2866724 RepID=A0A8J7FWM0_9NEIS|nr:pirin family protein [Chitinilyticum piscinae]MBE9608150.1 pirin family protein [Chitinilyticum piscinae]